MGRRHLLVALIASLLMTYPAAAQRQRGMRERPPEPTGAAPAAESQPTTQESNERPGRDNLSVTEGQVTVHGQPLRYKATAGTLALKDEAGKPLADMFFVAYQKQPASSDPSSRPITFVFNGGPGAAAVWLHLGVAGPRRIALNDVGGPPAPPYHLVDNDDTWLTATDLVFIDPVGTGFSRAAAGQKPEQFYGVEEDIRSVGQFIRLYTTRYQRWLSPKFLAGESYGTTRASALSQYLLDNGISLNGIILISCVLNFQTISVGNGNDLPYVLYLPTYTALAWYHKKLPADLQADLTKALNESEGWALNGYMAALALGSQLPQADRETAVKKLARLTGLSENYVDRANLRVDPSEFRKELLADQHQVLGRYDGRLTGYDTDPLSRAPDYDPSFSPFLGAYSATFNDYVRRTLKFDSDLPYEVLSGRVRPWNFGERGTGYLDVLDRLRAALVQSPNLKVLFNSSVFDLATPYLATKYTVNHLDLGTDLRKNIEQEFYNSGHMIYHHKDDRQKLSQAVTQFIKAASAQPAESLTQGDPAGNAGQR
jgi:carboxypeptidase C (cathepsin A)